MNHEHLKTQVKNIYTAVRELERMFPGRPFTPDGHMVGSLGECLVADAYNLDLMPPSNSGYDALSKTGTKVEIKATQSKSVAFRSCPEHAIIIKINANGSFVEYYNGPGDLIWQEFAGKQLPKNGQYQISLKKVAALYKTVPLTERLPKNS
ncbi:MAG: hypothetical protein ABW076_11720 [Candidatus Thiodiazotropha sp.]